VRCPQTPGNVLGQILYGTEDVNIRWLLAGHPRLEKNLQGVLAGVACLTAQTSVLARLAERRDLTDQTACQLVARNSVTPLDVIYELARDNTAAIRHAVCLDPNADSAALTILVVDDCLGTP
jgi:hypothetical protein